MYMNGLWIYEMYMLLNDDCEITLFLNPVTFQKHINDILI